MIRGRRNRTLLVIGAIPLLIVGTAAGLAATDIAQNRKDHALIQAIKDKKPSDALRILSRGADPNARDTGPAPPVTFHYLLDLVLGRRPRSTTGKPTALQLAVYNGEAPVVDVLLARGAAGVNEKDPDGMPLVVRACEISLHESTNLPVLKALVQHGANINATDANGVTPLIVAALTGQVEATRFLLGNKADVEAKITGNRCVIVINPASILGRADVTYPYDARLDRFIPHMEGVRPTALGMIQSGAMTLSSQSKDLQIASLLRQYGAKESVQIH